MVGFQQPLHLVQRSPRAGFECAAYCVLDGLVCRLSLLVHYCETFPVRVLDDANSLLLDEAVVSVRVEVSHIVGLLAERLLNVTLLHQEGVVVADDHPVQHAFLHVVMMSLNYIVIIILLMS